MNTLNLELTYDQSEALIYLINLVLDGEINLGDSATYLLAQIHEKLTHAENCNCGCE